MSFLGINYSITVQAAQTIEETKWLLEKVDTVDFVLGVVGWIELDTDEDSFLESACCDRSSSKASN